MKHKLVYLAAVFFLMLITGVFWGTWFTMTRSIESFSAEEFTHIGRVIIANVAMPMRIILPTGILLILVSLWIYKRKKTPAFYFGLLSLLLIISVLLITLIVLVPIDNDIKTWTTATTPGNWEEIRNQWKLWHAARTFLSLFSFVCFGILVVKRN